MGRNKVLSRDEVVKNLKRQLTECDINDIPTDAIRHLQMAKIICEFNYVFLDDVIETLANWLKMDTGEIPKGAISLLQDALDACRRTSPHKRRKVSVEGTDTPSEVFDEFLFLGDVTGLLGEWFDMDTQDIPETALAALHKVYDLCCQEYE
jgi:hypothetical protein